MFFIDIIFFIFMFYITCSFFEGWRGKKQKILFRIRFQQPCLNFTQKRNMYTWIFFILHVAPPIEIPDPWKDLEIRANKLNLLSPVYKMYSKKEKHSTKMIIYTSVKVNVSMNWIVYYKILLFALIDKGYKNFLHWLIILRLAYIYSTNVWTK